MSESMPKKYFAIYLQKDLTVLNCTFFIFRVISTILSLRNVENTNFDVKALRAFRVFRPLRLVSGVPSKSILNFSSVTRVKGTSSYCEMFSQKVKTFVH